MAGTGLKPCSPCSVPWQLPSGVTRGPTENVAPVAYQVLFSSHTGAGVLWNSDFLLPAF